MVYSNITECISDESPNRQGLTTCQSIRAQADLFADGKFAVDQAGWQPETKKNYGFFLKLYIGT